jgi:hypothetical protein
MHLSELLNEDAVSLSRRAHDKQSPIDELAELLESGHRVRKKGRAALECMRFCTESMWLVTISTRSLGKLRNEV